MYKTKYLNMRNKSASLLKHKSLVSWIQLICMVLAHLFIVCTIDVTAQDRDREAQTATTPMDDERHGPNRQFIETIKIYNDEYEAIKDLVELYNYYLQDDQHANTQSKPKIQ